jgi:hypothetical protein
MAAASYCSCCLTDEMALAHVLASSFSEVLIKVLVEDYRTFYEHPVAATVTPSFAIPHSL